MDAILNGGKLSWSLRCGEQSDTAIRAISRRQLGFISVFLSFSVSISLFTHRVRNHAEKLPVLLPHAVHAARVRADGDITTRASEAGELVWEWGKRVKEKKKKAF